jgi:DNA-binding response OmpR family regulator
MRILILDDDEYIRASLTLVINSMGHEALWAATGPAGLRLLRSEVPDLLILDILLEPGGQDGWAVLRQKIQDEAIRHIPTIILSGLTTNAIFDGASVVERALSGALLILGKPFDPRVLVAAIEAIASPEV